MNNQRILNNNRATTPSKAELKSKISELDDQRENGSVLTPFNEGLRSALLWVMGEQDEPTLEI